MDSEQTVVRRRRTPTEIQHILAEFLNSGMSQEEFCRSHDVCRSALYRYLSKSRSQGKSELGTQLVPVELVDVRRRSMSRGTGLTVLLGTGRKIEVGEEFDASTLERLLGVLERA